MASTTSASVAADCGCTHERCQNSSNPTSQEEFRSARLALMLDSVDPSVVALQAKQPYIPANLPTRRTSSGADKEPVKNTASEAVSQL